MAPDLVRAASAVGCQHNFFISEKFRYDPSEDQSYEEA